jgi:hypothetical protein
MSSITISISNNNLDVERELVDVISGYVKLLSNGLNNKTLEEKQYILNSVLNTINKCKQEPIIEEVVEPIIEEPVKPVITLPYYNFGIVDILLDDISSMKSIRLIEEPVIEEPVIEEPVIEDCPICYDAMVNPVTSCCGHKYCQACYDKINNCAMCRTDLGKPVVEIVPTQEEIESLQRIIEAVRSIVVFEIGDENAVRRSTNIAIAYARSNYINLNDLENTIETYLNSVDNYLDSE